MHTEYTYVPFETPLYEKMDIKNITEKGVEKLLQGLNITKAMGPDGIHPKVLKELATSLSSVLAHLFQQSVHIGNIPEDWKSANICPLYKKK